MSKSRRSRQKERQRGEGVSRSLLRILGWALAVGLPALYGYVEFVRPEVSCQASSGDPKDPFKAVFRVTNESRLLELRGVTAQVYLGDVEWDRVRIRGVKIVGTSRLEELGDLRPRDVRAVTFDLRGMREYFGIGDDVNVADFCVVVNHQSKLGKREQKFGYMFDPSLTGQLMERQCVDKRPPLSTPDQRP